MSSNEYGDYRPPYYGKSSAQIIIVSVTNNNIQGTFRGTGTPKPGSSPDNAITIKGKFNLDYK